jgi:hypothetical protein
MAQSKNNVFKEEAERLERQWNNPPEMPTDKEPTDEELKKQKDWAPLPEEHPNWRPFDEEWRVDDRIREARNNTEIVDPPLSEACVETLRNWWKEPTQVSTCGCGKHSAHGNSQHFHCYPIPPKATRDWIPWRRESRQGNGTAAPTWWCSNLYDAFKNYSWRKFRGGTFEQLACALQSAMRHGNQTLAAVVCLKILDWGGVRKGPRASQKSLNWLFSAISAGALIDNIVKAASALCPQSNTHLNGVFGVNSTIPMNSGSTKIFAAAAMDFSCGYHRPQQDVIIYDGRVSTALGFLARKLSCPRPVPPQFRFPYDNAHTHQGRRNASCAHTQFPTMAAQNDLARAGFTRLASSCIQQVLNVRGPTSAFIEAEKAIFMIGYHVTKMCCECPRPCP